MTKNNSIFLTAIIIAFGSFLWCSNAVYAETQTISFEEKPGKIKILVNGKFFATYVYEDANILRSFFSDIHTPCGIQVTRNNPPKKGIDRDDHATMHPGLWMAFGDINGHDFWRNKGVVRHAKFINPPFYKKDSAGFSVLNHYISPDKQIICMEECSITIQSVSHGYLILWQSEFFSPDHDFYFGDQEEMGLGFRVTTAITGKNGGIILNSNGQTTEKQVWGQQADWCDYSGKIDERVIGMTLIPSADNFRRSWFHAREYGLLLGNPFGVNAFTKGDKSKIPVKKGERFNLKYGVFIHSSKDALDMNQVNHKVQQLLSDN